MAVSPEDTVPIPWSVPEYDGGTPNPGSMKATLQNLQRQILANTGSIGGQSFFATVTPDTGVVDARSSLAAANATGLPIALAKYTNGVYLISSNITLTSPLWGLNGVLRPANGVTITLNCPIFGPERVPMFDLSLGGTLAGTPKCKEFHAGWIQQIDPTYTTDSAPYIQVAVDLCTGSNKPELHFAAGRYKMLSGVATQSTFGQPRIVCAENGSYQGTAIGTMFDARESTMTSSNAIFKFLSLSGQQSHGGMSGATIVGNGAGGAIGIQLANVTGLTFRNCSIGACNPGVQFYIQNGQGGVGAVEDCKFYDCLITNMPIVLFNTGGTCLVEFKRNLAGGSTVTDAALSFHGCAFYNCWFGMSNPCQQAFLIGAGCQWYDAYIDGNFFLLASASLIVPQFIFSFVHAALGHRATQPVQSAGGGIRMEGGLLFPAFGGIQTISKVTQDFQWSDAAIAEQGYVGQAGNVFYGGFITCIAGLLLGNTYQVPISESFGLESPANGNSAAPFYPPFGINQIAMESGVTGFSPFGGQTGVYVDLILECKRASAAVMPGPYYSRHTGYLQQTDTLVEIPAPGLQGGRFAQIPKSPIYGTLAVTPGLIAAGAQLLYTLPAPGINQPTDFVQVAYNKDLQGITISGYPRDSGGGVYVVDVLMYNGQAVGKTLADGIISVKVDVDPSYGWNFVDTAGFGPTQVTVDDAASLRVVNYNFPAPFSCKAASNEADLSTSVVYAPQIQSGVNADIDLAADTFVTVLNPNPSIPPLPSDLPTIWISGQRVIFHLASGTLTAVPPLVDGSYYYVIRVDSTHIQLAATHADAVAATPVPINLTVKVNAVWSIELSNVEIGDIMQYLTHYGVCKTTRVTAVNDVTHVIDFANALNANTVVYPYVIDSGGCVITPSVTVGPINFDNLKFFAVAGRVIYGPAQLSQRGFGIYGYTHGIGANLP